MEIEDETKFYPAIPGQKEQTDSRRIDLLEQELKHVKKTGDTTLIAVREMSQDLKIHIQEVKKDNEAQNTRLNNLETSHAKVKTDVRWIKLLGTPIIASIAGWLGLSK